MEGLIRVAAFAADADDVYDEGDSGPQYIRVKIGAWTWDYTGALGGFNTTTVEVPPTELECSVSVNTPVDTDTAIIQIGRAHV